jgi:hypothetical protein
MLPVELKLVTLSEHLNSPQALMEFLLLNLLVVSIANRTEYRFYVEIAADITARELIFLNNIILYFVFAS